VKTNTAERLAFPKMFAVVSDFLESVWNRDNIHVSVFSCGEFQNEGTKNEETNNELDSSAKRHSSGRGVFFLPDERPCTGCGQTSDHV
jgi:hypothetical protein